MPEHVESLTEAAKAIEAKIKSEQAGNEVYKTTAAIEDRLAGGEDYQSIQKDYPHLKIEKVSMLKSADKLSLKSSALSPEQAAQITKKIFQQSQGESGAMNDLSPTSFFSVTVDHINAARPKDFADVRADLLKSWTHEQQSQENLKAAEDWVAKLNQGQITLDHIAKDKAIKVQNFDDLSRKNNADQKPKEPAAVVGHAADSSSPYLKEPAIADRYLNVTQGKFIAAPSQDGGAIVMGRVTKTTLGQWGAGGAGDDTQKGDTQNTNDQAENFNSGLRDITANANAALLINSLERRYKVDINRALLDRIYAPVTNTE